MWEFVDQIVYINLEKRTDRNNNLIQDILPKFGNHPVSRFNAIENKNGAIGCYLSHINVLHNALQTNANNILIIEDDIRWNRFDENYLKLQELAAQPYDVIMLGGTAVEAIGNKVISANCSHGYLVNKHYIEKLLKTFEHGLFALTSNPYLYNVYGLDQFWKHLQKNDQWFILQPCMLYQLAGYSDIDEQYKPIDIKQPF